MTPDEIALILFLTLVAIHLYKRRRNVKFESIIVLEFWKGGMEWLDKFVEKHKKLLSHMETVSLYTGIGLMVVGVGFVLYSILQGKQALAIVLPSVGGVKYPGPVVSVPFWYWLIAIFIIAFPHESFHALFAKNEGVKIKKFGILYLLLLPLGAFVEPEKRRLEKLNWIKKSKIFTAGSFVNLITAALFLLLLIVTSKLTWIVLKPIGLNYTTIPGSPAGIAHLNGTILKIDGKRISDVYDLVEVLNKTKPGENIEVYTTKGVFNITLSERNGKAFLGITNITEVFIFPLTNSLVPDWIIKLITYWSNLLWWVFVLSLGVSIANMLPAKPLDGGLVVESYLKQKLGNKKGRKISNLISIVAWILFVLALSSGFIEKFIGVLRFF